MSSYRPELQGILAVLLLLNLLAESYSVPSNRPVLLVCDNEGATIEVGKIISDLHYSLDPKQTDCDILLEIQGAFQASTSTFKIQWIKGHQNDTTDISNLSLLSRLNIDCDARAKAYLRGHLTDVPPPPAVFHYERWSVFRDGLKITTKLPVAIFESYTARISLDYLHCKFQWLSPTIKQIAW